MRLQVLQPIVCAVIFSAVLCLSIPKWFEWHCAPRRWHPISKDYLNLELVSKIVKLNVSKVNKYVQSAQLNGKELKTFFFPASELLKGGELILTMGAEANKSWGKPN